MVLMVVGLCHNVHALAVSLVDVHADISMLFCGWRPLSFMVILLLPLVQSRFGVFIIVFACFFLVAIVPIQVNPCCTVLSMLIRVLLSCCLYS